MRTLFDCEAPVHCRQIYVQSDDRPFDLPEAFTGQVNGLCVAAAAGRLFLVTGLHTGEVPFTAERQDQPPPVDDGEWEDVVEASFTPATPAGGARRMGR